MQFRTVLACAAAAVAASAGTARAQSLFASPEAPFAGPYVGLHGGYAWDNDFAVETGDDINVLAVAQDIRPPVVDQHRKGFVGGGQLGWNVQRGQFVAGVEADGSYTDLGYKYDWRNPRQFGKAEPGRRSDVYSRTNYLTSARVRLGITRGALMAYGTAGYAYGHFRDQAIYGSSRDYPDFLGSREMGKSGWVAGAGAEYILPVHLGRHALTARAEYLHYDFGDDDLPVLSANSYAYVSYQVHMHHGADVARTALSLKF